MFPFKHSSLQVFSMSLNSTILPVAQAKNPGIILDFSFPTPSSLLYYLVHQQIPWILPENTSLIHLPASISIAAILVQDATIPHYTIAVASKLAFWHPLLLPADHLFSTQPPKQPFKNGNQSISFSWFSLLTKTFQWFCIALNPRPHPGPRNPLLLFCSIHLSNIAMSTHIHPCLPPSTWHSFCSSNLNFFSTWRRM